jgi:hypothetical protein
MLMAVVTGLGIAMPLLGAAAPNEAQKQLTQRAQDAAGTERQEMMQGMSGMGMHGMNKKQGAMDCEQGIGHD